MNAFDAETGLLKESTFYEGGKWNYSFRLTHDMAARIALAGGDQAFVRLLDEFVGFGADVVHAVVHQQFGTGRGGLPRNDHSDGLSSWYVWAALGRLPVAGQSLFLINAPAWRESRITVAGHAQTTATSGFVEPEQGGPAQYLQPVRSTGSRWREPGSPAPSCTTAAGS